MSFRCLSIMAFLMAGRPASGGFTLLAWMRPQRTTRGMGRAPLREEGQLYCPGVRFLAVSATALALLTGIPYLL